MKDNAMAEQQIPFHIQIIDAENDPLFHNGRLISFADKCGLFLCRRGEVEVSYDGRTYLMQRNHMYVYMSSTLVHLLCRSDDAEGILAEIDLNFVMPLANKVVSVESLLGIRQYPCISLSGDQFRHLERLFLELIERIEDERRAEVGQQQFRRLKMELLKSMGQSICYEVMDMYFTNHPVEALPRSKKDVVFQKFMVSLSLHYRREREVTFYAGLQHLAPRYFSTIIKEKSGSSAMQWIVRMVIAEAKLLLESSELSIKEIAVRLNFPNQSFFGKYFKQYVGMSPKDFRNMLQSMSFKESKGLV